MKHFFVMLLAVLCLTHLVSTGGRNKNKGGRKLRELEEKLSNMEKTVASMMEGAKQTKAKFEEVGGKADKMLMFFAKKYPKFFCALCPNWSYYDGCNWCWCYQGKVVCTKKYCGPPEFCKLNPDVGTDWDSLTRYYYDFNAGKCKEFSYSGAGGNKNNFETLEECQKQCSGSAGNVCPDGSNPSNPAQTCAVGDKMSCPEGHFCHTSGVCCSNRGCPPIEYKICLRQGSCQRRDGKSGCDPDRICCPDSPSCGTACMRPVRGCIHDGKVLQPGDTVPADDGCNTCTCLYNPGSSSYMMACTLMACIGCEHNGCHYKVGDPIPPDDGCNACSCAGNNLQRCTLIGCPPNKRCPASVPIPLHRPGSIVRQCNNTGDCPDGKICCAKDCHHVCVDPPPPLPSNDLVCPIVKPGTHGTCDERCRVGGCGQDRRCCSNGCGHLCKLGKKPNLNCPKYRRLCQAPSQNFCTGKCDAGEECCPDGCGGSKCTTVSSTTPSPCNGGPLQLRPDGTPVECSSGDCPAPEGYCDTSTNICCR